MKKIIVTIALALFFLVPALRGQGAPISIEVPDADKIKIEGYTMFYASVPYLSITAILSNRGTPVLGAKIRMNDVELRGSSGGFYAGSIPSYKSNLGDDYVFSVEMLARLPSGGVSPRRERVVLASYRVDNLLTWISPSPGQVIDLSAYPLGEIPVRWRFAGTPVPFELRVVDNVTHAVLISHMVDSEGFTIPTAGLLPGKSYWLTVDTRGIAGAAGPLARFKLGKLAATGSSVRFDCAYAFGFSTAAAK